MTQTKFFSGLSESQLALVASVSRVEEWPSGHSIYKIGENANTLYVLMDGMVRFAISLGSRETSAGDILHRGQVFGWSSLTPTSNIRLATASCMTTCKILAIDGKGLSSIMEQDHTIGYRVLTQVTALITGTLVAFACG
ncbi:cyclic nucleotide-binding domain-containing protein [Glaciimonas sp. CA11.2]|uniref:cyclic nucleotide-binding domain-containing protein n=1 Tax=unclassified Glaciimonas TaxID=2644401 RepID=UPI002B22270E|nr:MULTISPECIES: cyclic nucleotide-binding domain-containing protein [unclassified Glaciimonas]MEB0012971.1 cyclic nucleotide-binding domain-containing protein [Glaciimonas sp. Cout2]MEB0082927.1 cyclic nucleotide-binding domain-containing protein [Glaciimonas sp. Gout2]MEB0161374.1 cyclic nucleotide-binding domain-containing protein [Glaciimonas sp. CA11.2]